MSYHLNILSSITALTPEGHLLPNSFPFAGILLKVIKISLGLGLEISLTM